MLAAARDEAYRGRLSALADAIEEGELAEEAAAELERVLELGLQAGRIRAVYGPSGEQAALRLFRRLPAGAGLAETARSVSAALSTLNGRPLDSFRIEVVGPGMYKIALVAGGAEVAVPARPKRRPTRFDRRLSHDREASLRGVCGPRRSQRARGRGRPRRAREGERPARLRRRGDRRRARDSSGSRRASRRAPAAQVPELHLDGRYLVVAATADRAVNELVFADAEARALLCNVVDVPEPSLSSSPRCTARTRSPWPFRPGALHPSSRSGFGTRSPRS